METTTSECEICGCDIGPSDSYPWHFVDEDCRSIHMPTCAYCGYDHDPDLSCDEFRAVTMMERAVPERWQ